MVGRDAEPVEFSARAAHGFHLFGHRRGVGVVGDAVIGRSLFPPDHQQPSDRQSGQGQVRHARDGRDRGDPHASGRHQRGDGARAVPDCRLDPAVCELWAHLVHGVRPDDGFSIEFKQTAYYILDGDI